VNRLIRIAGERTGTAFAAFPTAACVYTATEDGEHEGKAPDEDVWPVACYRSLEVLFLLSGRNWGVRLLRGGEENVRGGRACAVLADLSEVGEGAGRIG
jgi:hypothetical protein